MPRLSAAYDLLEFDRDLRREPIEVRARLGVAFNRQSDAEARCKPGLFFSDASFVYGLIHHWEVSDGFQFRLARSTTNISEPVKGTERGKAACCMSTPEGAITYSWREQII